MASGPMVSIEGRCARKPGPSRNVGAPRSEGFDLMPARSPTQVVMRVFGWSHRPRQGLLVVEDARSAMLDAGTGG